MAAGQPQRQLQTQGATAGTVLTTKPSTGVSGLLAQRLAQPRTCDPSHHLTSEPPGQPGTYARGGIRPEDPGNPPPLPSCLIPPTPQTSPLSTDGSEHLLWPQRVSESPINGSMLIAV